MQNWLSEKILILMEKIDIRDRELREDECEIVDNLIDLEKNLSKEKISSLLYIAGYVQKDASEIDDTIQYYENYGDFINVLNRGGLTISLDSCVQWIIFCYILFTQLTDDFCQSFLTNQFESIAMKYTLQIQRKHGKKLANTFTKNYSVFKTLRSTKECIQKVLKLS